ncbi:hypothetical protein K1X76_11835 [bacterium]|nr:hypothetical protein [bacterium]
MAFITFNRSAQNKLGFDVSEKNSSTSSSSEVTREDEAKYLQKQAARYNALVQPVRATDQSLLADLNAIRGDIGNV